METSPQEKLSREQINDYLHRHLSVIAPLAGIPLTEGEAWGIRLLSWTGEEWPGLEGRPGLCFVDLFVSREPHDYLIILDISTGICTLAGSYRREFKHLHLLRAWSPSTDSRAYAPLPDTVPWRILREHRARQQSGGHLIPTMPQQQSPPSPNPHPPMNRAAMEAIIRRDIKLIAKQSALVGVDAPPWDVTRISWTGEEWPGLPHLPGHCYVEAFEHANPPHDFLYLVSVLTGTPEFIACYEGDIATFDLTLYRTEAESLGLPDKVDR
jgi:hypothetical protein